MFNIEHIQHINIWHSYCHIHIEVNNQIKKICDRSAKYLLNIKYLVFVW